MLQVQAARLDLLLQMNRAVQRGARSSDGLADAPIGRQARGGFQRGGCSVELFEKSHGSDFRFQISDFRFFRVVPS